MNAAAQAARSMGFAPMAGPHNSFGIFTASGFQTWRVHFEGGHTYFIAAGCTGGCDTLDFVLNEPHGNTMMADTTAGPTPRLVFTATDDGDYPIVFRFGRCAVAQCRWVAQVYTKGDTRP